jgi:hypothetical protein
MANKILPNPVPPVPEKPIEPFIEFTADDMRRLQHADDFFYALQVILKGLGDHMETLEAADVAAILKPGVDSLAGFTDDIHSRLQASVSQDGAQKGGAE